MNQNIKTVVIAVLAAAGLAGCDPWTDENKSSPQVIRVLGVESALLGTGGSSNTEATNTNGTWVVDTYFEPEPTADDPAPAPIQVNLIQIQANKLLDGASIQASPSDCTPAAGGLVVTSTPAPPAGSQWFTCYLPSSPNVDQGGSIMVFQGASATPTALGTDANPRAADELAAGTVVTITGSVKDQQGQTMPVSVTATY